MRLLSPETANAIYSLLAELGGAHETDRSNFVYHFTQAPDGPPGEWRFQGIFGFGGKVYLTPDRWCVGCYREDDTPERTIAMARINAQLEELRLRASV